MQLEVKRRDVASSADGWQPLDWRLTCRCPEEYEYRSRGADLALVAMEEDRPPFRPAQSNCGNELVYSHVVMCVLHREVDVIGLPTLNRMDTVVRLFGLLLDARCGVVPGSFDEEANIVPGDHIGIAASFPAADHQRVILRLDAHGVVNLHWNAEQCEGTRSNAKPVRSETSARHCRGWQPEDTGETP